jgi:GNAT superfamily N-acetyltransferase
MTEIRKCSKEDLPAMLDLVNELAEFEKEGSAVVASLAEYEESFSKNLFDALVAVHNGEVVGMALYYPIFSTWKGKCIYLEDFVVKTSHRSAGLGQQIWDELLAEVKRQGCRQLRWQVLDWNEHAVRFYERNNAVILKDWWNGRIILNDE